MKSAARRSARDFRAALFHLKSARGSRPETEIKGLAGNEARTAPAAGDWPGRYHRIFRPGVRARKRRLKALRGMEREPHLPAAVDRAAIIGFFGPGFAPVNRDQRLCGEWSANRTRRRRSTGPLLLVFSARGSRSETEVKGFAGNGARTAPAAGGRPGRYHRIFRPGVRARKRKLKALQGMEREPHPPPAVDRAAITGFFGPWFAP